MINPAVVMNPFAMTAVTLPGALYKLVLATARLGFPDQSKIAVKGYFSIACSHADVRAVPIAKAPGQGCKAATKTHLSDHKNLLHDLLQLSYLCRLEMTIAGQYDSNVGL